MLPGRKIADRFLGAKKSAGKIPAPKVLNNIHLIVTIQNAL